jgi:hypothetical protein
MYIKAKIPGCHTGGGGGGGGGDDDDDESPLGLHSMSTHK